MSRIYKFRAWDAKAKMMKNPINGNWYVVELNETELPIMQYTGLKDKNGKEIYEGDIVDNGGKVAKIVYWSKQTAEWRIGCQAEKTQFDKSSGFIWGGSDLKIIGNIYENPEMLKEE